MGHAVRQRDLVVALLSALGGILLLFIILLLLGSDLLDKAHGNGSADAQNAATFSLSGDSKRPITPGVRVPLNLTITNPHDFAISVSKLTVRVISVSAPNRTQAHACSVADFTVAQVAGGMVIRVPAHKSGALKSFDIVKAAWPRVGMLDRSVNQDGCQGATLTLAYAASGSRAS